MADQSRRASAVPNAVVPGNIASRRQAGDTLADVLERVLDKGIVIVGDIGVNILDIELLTLKVRLFIASADTAREMGIDWWTTDPSLSSSASRSDEGDNSNRELRDRVEQLERALAGRSQTDPDTEESAESPSADSAEPDDEEAAPPPRR